MKNILFPLLVLLIGCEDSQKKLEIKYPKLTDGNYIEWHGDNPLANELALVGVHYFMNIEFEKAYPFFEEALRYDSTMFAPHVCLAEMALNGSEKQKFHIAEAKKNVADNNETSKLFVSLLDNEPDGKFLGYFDSSKALNMWKKMHEMEPKGRFIQLFYALNLEDTEKSIDVTNSFIEIAKKQGFRHGFFNNLLGYRYLSLGNKEKSKLAFENYINAYPKGNNPYDSMADFYLKTGDTLIAKKLLKKAIETYPFAQASKNKLKSLQ